METWNEATLLQFNQHATLCKLSYNTVASFPSHTLWARNETSNTCTFFKESQNYNNYVKVDGLTLGVVRRLGCPSLADALVVCKQSRPSETEL